MKKILLILSVFFLSFGLAPHVFAACSDYSQFKSIPGKTSGCAQMLGSGWTIVDNACLPNSSLKDTVCGLPVNTAVPTVPAQPQAQPSATPTGNNNAPQGFTALAPIPGLTDTNGAVVNSKSLTDFFNNLYKYLIGLAAILAVIRIIWAGFEIMRNKDNVSTLMESKGKISQAIFGLVLVLSPVLVFSIINPSILNLSLNLPALNNAPVTQVGNGTGSGNGTQQPTTDATTNCSVIGTNGILQIAKCPSDVAANKWGQNCTDGKLSKSQGSTGTKLADGTIITPATVSVICTGKQTYVFINTKGTLSFSSSIARLQPLAHTTDNPNNGDSAMQFANICHNANLGLKTCISRGPALGWSSTCDPVPSTPLPDNSGAIGKCYKETLTCEDKNFLANDTCSANPSWTPFQ